MTDLNDKDLDHLLSTLATPEPPAGLTQRIMNALPERKQSWKDRLSNLFDTNGLALPASGALACLLVGATLGYGPITDLPAETSLTDVSEEEWLVADVFGGDTFDASLEELTN